MSQPEKPLGDEQLDEGGERIWPGIIQLPLQADILREAQLNRPLYDKKLVAPAPKDITIIPYVSSYFMKGSEFDVKPPPVSYVGKSINLKKLFNFLI